MRALRWALAVGLAFAWGCGDITSGLSASSTRLDGSACHVADDCPAPMACCLTGIATYGDSGDLATAQAEASPKCMAPNEYCDAYAPQLLEGQPCGRGAPELDLLGEKVLFIGLDDCRDGMICCPSTLTCGAAAACPATPAGGPVLSDAGVAGVDGVVEGPDAGGAEACSSDDDCGEGLLCCGISYRYRDGTCVAPRACGATEYAGGGGSDAGGGGSNPGVEAPPCTRPRGDTPAACYGAPTVLGSPGLALVLNFDDAAVCDASGQNHHGTLLSGVLAPGQGVQGSAALDGVVTLPIYDTMQPLTGLTLSLFVRRTTGGDLVRAGADISLASNRCGEVSAQVWGAAVETPCDALPAQLWVHLAVVAEPAALSLFIDGQASVAASGAAVTDACGTLALGSDGFDLDQVSWWTRALGPDEICGLAGKGWLDGQCR